MSTTYFRRPKMGELNWLAVDFDNTLAKSVWPRPGIGGVMPGVLDKIAEAIEAGWKIVVHTSRSWADYEQIELWLKTNEVPYHRIVCGKLLAAAYIDDRNIAADAESWIPKR